MNKTFISIEGRNIDDLPDQVLEALNAKASSILLSLCVDAEGTIFDPNFVFAVLQKAIGIHIAMHFPYSEIDTVTECLADGANYNAKLWCKDKE